MKKFAIGCLIVLALVMVGGGVGLYFAYDRLIRPGMEMASSVKELGKLGEIERQVRNTDSFATPQGEELTQPMVKRFIEVQQHVQTALGPRMAELKAKYEQLDRSLSGDRRDVSVRELASGLKDLTSIVLQAKNAQVEGLNQAGFSVREYEWVRQQVYAAIGVAAVGFDMKKMAAEAQAGNVQVMTRRPERASVPDASEHNKALVAPYEGQLKEWAPLAFFGL